MTVFGIVENDEIFTVILGEHPLFDLFLQGQEEGCQTLLILTN